MNQIRKSKIRDIQAEYCQRAGLEPYGKTFELTIEMWMDMAAAFGLMVIDDEPEEDIDGDWNPIETAPKDRELLLCWNPEWECPEVCCYIENRCGWIGPESRMVFPDPTHWTAIPKLPDTKKAAS